MTHIRSVIHESDDLKIKIEGLSKNNWIKTGQLLRIKVDGQNEFKWMVPKSGRYNL